MCCSCSKGYLIQILGKKLPNDKDAEHWDKMLRETVKSLLLKDFKNGLDTHCLGVTQVCFDSARGTRLQDLSR